MSTVINPVTQVALTAVHAASRGFVKVPLAEEIGRVRRMVPNRISPRKPMENTAVELILRWDAVAFFTCRLLLSEKMT